MAKMKLADFFFVAGLDENKLDREAVGATQPKLPLEDLAVIDMTRGETVPSGFECCELTPTNFPANLNHGTLMAHEMYLCFKRGNKKPPIVDIGSFYRQIFRLD